MDNNSQPLYNSKKSGIAFTMSAIIPVMLSFIFALTVQIIAASNSVARGLSVTELYNEYISKNWFIYASFLISQFSFFLIILYFHKYQNIKIQKIVKVKFNSKYIFIGLIMSFGLLFGLSYANEYFLKFLKIFGLEPAGTSIPSMNTVYDFILSLIIIACMPAIFEELLFRGIIINGIKKIGTAQAVLSCGILFALFHQNPSQTVYQFINGALFALLAIRSGSVIPTMMMHFINNAYILTIYYLFPEFELIGSIKIIIIVLALLAIISTTIYLIFFDKNNAKKKTEDAKTFFKYSAFGILLCSFLWIAGLI